METVKSYAESYIKFLDEKYGNNGVFCAAQRGFRLSDGAALT